jgi:hypothetical protein
MTNSNINAVPAIKDDGIRLANLTLSMGTGDDRQRDRCLTNLDNSETQTDSSCTEIGTLQIIITGTNLRIIQSSSCEGGGSYSGNASHSTESNDDVWWDCEGAAAYLHMTPKSVREGAARGTLPGHKYPLNSKRGRWKFRRDELCAWLSRKPIVRKTKGVTLW